jgi:hypothetical protein
MAAFTNRQVDAPAPRPATSSTTPTAPTAPAPVATVHPAPAPVAVPVAVPVYAQTTTDTTPVATPATSDARKCLGCGNPLPADARPNARYCSRKNPDGTRDQSCKNRYHAAQQRAKSQRATLAATVDAMTQQRTAAAAFA